MLSTPTFGETQPNIKPTNGGQLHKLAFKPGGKQHALNDTVNMAYYYTTRKIFHFLW